MSNLFFVVSRPLPNSTSANFFDMHVCVCVDVCMCVCVCVCVCMYVILYVCLSVCLSGCLSVCLYICTHVRTYVCMYVHIHNNIYVYIYIYTIYIHMCFTSLFKYIIIYPYTQNVHLYKDINGLNIALILITPLSLTAIIVAIIVMVTISVMSQDMSGLNPEFLGCFMLFHVQSLMRVCICLYGVLCRFRF